MALGNNEEAARFSGINVDRMVILAYVILAALLQAWAVCFSSSASIPLNRLISGIFMSFTPLLPPFWGGCSLRGGAGTIIGVVIGTALMQVNCANMIVLVDWIPTHIEYAIIGAVILAGVVADELLKKAVARRQSSKA